MDDCYNDWPKCGDSQIRCPDQSCANDQNHCLTTIICKNPDDFICPDRICVSNEIHRSKLKTCPDETPYLCTDYSCAPNPESCNHFDKCGHNASLCSNLICLETC